MRYPVGCPRKVRLLEQQGRLPHLALPEIHIGELLAVVVAHDKAGVQFLDGPGRPKAGAWRVTG
jgi:hypothetical protein